MIQLLIFLLLAFNSLALSDQEKAQLQADVINLLPNAGFEARSAGWTNSGSGTLSIDESSPLDGQKSAVWDPAAASDTLESDAITISRAMIGQKCQVIFFYNWQGTEGEIEIKVLDTGSEIFSRDLLPTTSDGGKYVESFDCPGTDTDTLKIKWAATADTSSIEIDGTFLGTGRYNIQKSSDYEYLGALTTTGAWTTNTTYAGNYWRSGDKLIGEVLVTLSGAPNSASLSINLPSSYTIDATKLNDGSQVVGDVGKASLRDNATRSYPGFLTANGTTAVFVYTYEDSGSFEQFSVVSETNPFTFANLDEIKVRFEVPITQFSEKVGNQNLVTFPTSGWFVDANIGGSNPVMSTASITSYSAIVDSGLDLINNTAKGSATCEIPCNGGNTPSGLTCSAGNEVVGISCEVPSAGRYKYCFTFGHATAVAGSSFSLTTFQLIEFNDNLTTQLQTGGQKIPSTNQWNVAGSTLSPTKPTKICGNFIYTSTGRKTVLLDYVHNPSGTVNTNIILADRSSGNLGERDIHVTIEKMDEHKPTPVFADLTTDLDKKIDTPDTTGTWRMCQVFVDYTGGVPAIGSQTDGCVSSLTDNGVGDITINWDFTWASPGAACYGVASASTGYIYSMMTQTTTTTRMLIDSDAGTATDEDSYFLCFGEI